VPVFLFSALKGEIPPRAAQNFLEERMETEASLSTARTSRVSKRCFVAAVIVFLTGVLFGAIGQAQILGTGQLNSARRGHTATLLQDGKILIVGGDDANGLVGQAEIFDPATKTSTAGPSLGTARTDHSAIALSDGRVLVIGGRDQNGALTSLEIYDPLTGSFTSGPSMTTPRSGHTATILSDGKILIAGGDAAGSAEIYNPATQSFSPIAATMAMARKFHSAILTSSGQVLIVGGVNAQNAVLNTAEVYDPASQSFYLPPSDTQTPRAFATLRLLPDGKVQIIGGDSDFSMEIFDPQDGTFKGLAYLPPTPELLGATLSTRSRAALVSPYASINPNLLGTTLTPDQLDLLDRADHTITELPSQNQALVAGGINSAGQVLSSASLVSSSPASVTTDKTDYAPGTIATITGKGFQRNEDVALTLHERPDAYPDFAFMVSADNQGNFVFMQFAPQSIDIGRSFTLTAVGQVSGFSAQTSFSDAPRIASVTVGSQTGTLTYGTAGSATYTVTPVRGNNGTVNGTLSVISGLPAGVIASFSPNSGTWTSNGGTAFPSFTLTLTTSAATLAGTFTFTVQAADGGDTATGTGTLTIGKRNATWTTNAASKTYGDADPVPLTTGSGSGFLAADGVTAIYSRATGETASPPTYHIAATLSAIVSGALNNYNITNTGAEFTINKRSATWTTDPNSKTYGDSDPSPLTTGSGSGFVTSDNVTATYSRTAGETVAGNPYHITATLSPAGVLGNYTITNAGADFTISAKAASVTPNVASKTYGDSDPTFTGTLSGFVAADGVTATYSRTVGENVAGSPYTISATLSPAGVLGNYAITYNTANFTINKANATCTVNGYTGIYDSAAHGATGSCKGVDGTTVLAGLNLGASFTNVPGGTTNWAFTDVTGNYNDQSGSVAVVINKADATITVNGYTGVYDGNSHGATGTATGVGGVDLNGLLNLGSTFTNVPGGTAHWVFTGGTNYNDASGDVAIVINKANAIITVNGYTGFYDGNAHGATGTAAGLGGADLTGSLNLGTTFTNAPGGTAHWVFNGGINYNDAGGDVTIVINQVTPTVSVTGGTFIDDAQPHGATAFAYGIGGVSDVLNPALTFSYTGTGSTTYGPTASAPSTPGTYLATAIFAGNQNYTGASNSDSITIKNAAPQAKGQSVATNEDVPLPITLRARDLDSPSLSFIITGSPTNGSLGSIATDCTPVPIAPGAMSCTGTVTYSPNQDYNGADSFKFKINDGELDSNEATVSITVYPVNDAPTANAQSVTTDDFTPLAIALTGTDIETDPANLTFTIVDAPLHGSLSGIPPNVTYAPNFNYKGPDSFTFTVTDRGDPDNCGAPRQTCADAKTSPKATLSITVTDGTPPQTLITALKPASLSNDRNPSFGFSATDNVADASALSFECNLDYAVEWTLCGTAGNPTTSYSNLADGSHTFQVRGKDDSGNVDLNPPSYTWTIDATPPDTTLTSEPPAIATSSMASFAFQSSENDSTLFCSLDGAPGVDCSAGTMAYTGLSDGPHTFIVAATDQAGNVDPMPASYVWNIDTTAPQTNIDNQPTNPTTSTSASFTFHGSDPAGQDTFECSLDGASFAACSSPKNYNGLGLGNHSFAVRAKDSVGNMDASPATYSWTIGTVTLENYTMDTDFKRFDGFDVVFGKGTGSYFKINSTNPDSFHYQIKLTNNSGAPIGPAYGNTVTAIITVPGMPSSCGGVACSSQVGSLADPAFIVRGKKVVHLTPGHDRDDDDDDDMPVTIQYKSSGSCDVTSGYSSTLPSNGAAKCIKITGFSIPVKHSARIRINFQFRLKGTDGWNATAQQLFYAGFIFRATTAVSFGPNTQMTTDSTGIIGAGSKATAIGGYAFNNVGSPLSGYAVRIFGKMTDASCTSDSKLVAQDIVDGNGFYYVWRTGSDQHIVAPNLPSGVQYAVQLCNGSSQIGVQRIDSKLRDKEFEQIDFNP
jgi:MBG domain-containing protein/Big-like domain-containing protein/Kelch motif protein/galactose oxidase-like protein